MMDTKRKEEKRAVGPKNPVKVPSLRRIAMPHEDLIRRPLPDEDLMPDEVSQTGNPVSQSPSLGTQSPSAGTQSPTVGAQIAEKTPDLPETGTQSPSAGTQSPIVGDWEPSLPVSQSPISLQTQIEAGYPSRQLRTKKGWRVLNTQLEQLGELAFITGADEQDLVGEALELLLAKYFGSLGTQSPSELGTQSPSLPVINSVHELTKNDLIRLFEKLTGKRWDANTDEQHFGTVSNYSAEVIELGIRLSKQRADKARSFIRTFKYCLGAINEAHRMDDLKRRQKLLYLRHEQDKPKQ